MARKPLTERQAQLKAAYKVLAIEKAQLRTIRARVEAARRAVEAFNRCDECGQWTLSAGLEPTLCASCTMARCQAERAAVLSQHGYGPDGKKLARVTAAA